MDRRIKLINEYVNRLTQGKVKELVEAKPNLFRIDFRSGTAKIEVQVHLQEDILCLRSTLFEATQISDKSLRMKLLEELMRLNSNLETMSAKFGLSEDNFIEVIVARKDLKDLDYSEFLTALKNVCTVADVKGGEIAARYVFGKGAEMDITPLDSDA